MTDSICSACKASINIQDNLHEYGIDPIAGLKPVYQIDLMCPTCGDTHFICYTNDRLKKQADIVSELFNKVAAGDSHRAHDLQRKSAKHKREFDKFNKKVARITGQKLPLPVIKKPVKLNWPAGRRR